MNKKRFGVLAGVGAVLGSGGLLAATMLPSSADTSKTEQPTAQTQATAISYGYRYFQCSQPKECHATAVLPKTWKHVYQGGTKTAFNDPTANRMIRFNTWLGDKPPSTEAAARKKVADLKGVSGLKIQNVYTARMQSTNSQGRLTMTTVVYTYKSGKTTRWVATRYLGQHGENKAQTEITVGGVPADYKLLGTALLKATQSFALAG
ncbi:hypothetical protein HPO96_07140 [Kribbella sandramycini]|uniref:Polyketide cyclase/dehydrase/lipid transport protein n=1 Tax=Kribbella sandramycini TaxID=60450 RepID=A0A7Y4KWR5_9ACTN|nr:hypothetical protein [Kribbella sandramycini]MBB6567373.1 hypothetical protein [Kribbella sandramycini]NOL40014.1 hypothetical protein [Kribbella sandramycini]